jgi:hypothetical protein
METVLTEERRLQSFEGRETETWVTEIYFQLMSKCVIWKGISFDFRKRRLIF